MSERDVLQARVKKMEWGKDRVRTRRDKIDHESTRCRRERKLFRCLFGELHEGVVNFLDFVPMRDP